MKHCVCCGMVAEARGIFCNACLKAVIMPWEHADLELVTLAWRTLAIASTRWRETPFIP